MSVNRMTSTASAKYPMQSVHGGGADGTMGGVFVDRSDAATVTIDAAPPRQYFDSQPGPSGGTIRRVETHHTMTPHVSLPQTVHTNSWTEELQPTVNTRTYESIPRRDIQSLFPGAKIVHAGSGAYSSEAVTYPTVTSVPHFASNFPSAVQLPSTSSVVYGSGPTTTYHHQTGQSSYPTASNFSSTPGLSAHGALPHGYSSTTTTTSHGGDYRLPAYQQQASFGATAPLGARVGGVTYSSPMPSATLTHGAYPTFTSGASVLPPTGSYTSTSRVDVISDKYGAPSRYPSSVISTPAVYSTGNIASGIAGGLTSATGAKWLAGGSSVASVPHETNYISSSYSTGYGN